jgi:multidrug efflux system membrane fusion protein
MRQRRFLFLIPASALAVLVVLGCGRQQAAGPPPAPPPAPVTVARVTTESVPTEIRVVGTGEASAIVQVRSQVSGPLLKVAFTEGQNVQQGDLLFEIDPRPFEDTLRQAEAAVTRDRAQIAQAEAVLSRENEQTKLAEADAARYAELQESGVVSKAQADQFRTQAAVSRESARAAQATIESARAALEADLAAVAAAKLNLSYTRIHAPVSGRTGNLLVHAGNLVKANDVPLVVIHRIQPIFVNFAVPEQHLAAIRRLSTGRKLQVTVFAKDNPSTGAHGSLSVIDNTVDPSTGTIRLKATFENRERTLWPGQFVNVVLTLDTIQNATVVPAVAVQNGQQGQFVYVVKPDNHVEPRVVKVGRAFGERMMVESGLAPGETVVTDGQLRLFPGAEVRIVEAGKQAAG